MRIVASPVVHLELHTSDADAASDFYEDACGWRAQAIETPYGRYTGLRTGGALDGGIVECETNRSLWLPYVEVPDVGRATERASALGASILLEPREGPAGWRSVVATPAGGEIAFWRQKR